MTRRLAQRRGNEARAVTLVLVEGQRVRKRGRVDLRARVDREARRRRRRRPGDGDGVRPGLGDGVEVERVYELVRPAPRTETRTDRSGEDTPPGRSPHAEGRAGFVRDGHEIRTLRPA